MPCVAPRLCRACVSGTIFLLYEVQFTLSLCDWHVAVGGYTESIIMGGPFLDINDPFCVLSYGAWSGPMLLILCVRVYLHDALSVKKTAVILFLWTYGKCSADHHGSRQIWELALCETRNPAVTSQLVKFTFLCMKPQLIRLCAGNSMRRACSSPPRLPMSSSWNHSL